MQETLRPSDMSVIYVSASDLLGNSHLIDPLELSMRHFKPEVQKIYKEAELIIFTTPKKNNVIIKSRYF